MKKALVLAALAATLTLAAPAVAERTLTGPAEGTPVEIALGYLDANKAALGLTPGDLADLIVKDQYVTRHNGVTHLYLYQRLGGVEVVNGVINVNVMPDGSILNLGNRFVSNLAAAANSRSPAIEPDEAVARAAEHLGVEPAGSIDLLEVVGGPAMEVRFSDAGISKADIPAKLQYLPLRDGSGAVRLVWSLLIGPRGTADWWNLFVDAVTGEVRLKFNYTVYEERVDGVAAPPGPVAAASAAPAKGLPAADVSEGGGCADNCYRVFAIPKESPLDGPRTLEADPADSAASPFGWHDTNGLPGAEFTDTQGNNVIAQTDVDANDSFGPPDIRPDGGPNLIFDSPLDLGLGPETYQEAAVTNLFYWNNVMHDLTFHYGFDAPAGNFQTNNYGAGGAGNDAVRADAQDGSGTNNANFATFPDGVPLSRMQMFVWIDSGPFPNGRLTVNSPAGIAGDYVAGRGSWGGELDPSTTADLELVEDGSGNNQGCSALIGFTPGNIALIDRGTCEFGVKALNAETAGASGAVIINDQQLPNGIIVMGAGASGGSVTIPAVMIGNADGATIRGELPAPGVNGTLQCPIGGCPEPNPIDRDSDLDNGVIAHEYGHGISNRLVGGPGNVGCIFGDERMGEGWSDWWTLVLSPEPGDTGPTPRGIGSYLSFEGPDGPGIRNFPYSTDLTVNPQTFLDINGTNIPHGVGEIWNAMLWEMYWLLVGEYGFDPDLYNGTGGNNLAIQLVIDGMKLGPCGPTFETARDAILAADVANNGGANECLIWRGFAKRGLGASASSGTTDLGDEVEAFDLPDGTGGLPDCQAIFTDGFESGDTSAWSGSIP